jgi:flagellar biosynthetic protein FliR
LRIIAVEAAFGISAGVVVAWLNEALVIAMQVLATQAGYTYSSMIDPTTHADSGTLPVLAQLIAMLLFFTAGMDRAILEAFGASLTTMPPGTFRLDGAAAQAVLQYTSAMLTLAVRLALPLVALLILVDLALALLGRLNSQLQLLSMAMPAKMLLSLLVLASLASVLPLLYRQAVEAAMPVLWRLARITYP